MEIEKFGCPGSGYAKLKIGIGESCVVESGRMIALGQGLSVSTSTQQRKGIGGIFKALGRKLAGGTLFLNHYTSSVPLGVVMVGPQLPGDLTTLQLHQNQIVLSAGSFLACEHGIDVQMSWQGAKSLFSGKGLFWMKAEGSGKLLLSSFGQIIEQEVDGEFIVDTSHVVAFDESLHFEISKAGHSWLHSFLGGEGLICHFKGRGRLWYQSHNPVAYGTILGSLLPAR